MDQRIELPVNTQIGSYRIEKMLGRGGFAITYQALDTNTGRQVAIKEYYPWNNTMRVEGTMNVQASAPEYQDDFARGVQKFDQEARTLVKFRHKNIVSVENIFYANNTVYMVLAFERGIDMNVWLKTLGRAPNQDELDRIVGPVLDALHIIHKNQLLHRDMSPDNIFIREDTTPVLLDFGSARPPDGLEGAGLTIIVKAGYSPYEQYLGDPDSQGSWSDIYATGATLYRAIVGNPPPDSRNRKIKDDMASVSQRASGQYRPAFLAAIDHALAVDPHQRPQTVAQWRSELFSAEINVPQYTSQPVRQPLKIPRLQVRNPLSGLLSKIGSLLR